MAEQGTAARLIEVATAELGTIEGPKDNQTKYGAYTKMNFQPWCGSFVNWCGNEAGVKIPKTVYTPSGAQAFKKAGSWTDSKNAKPVPGDIAYFDFPSDGVDRISHVGIVVKDNGDGTVWCIEGNTSPEKKAGSQRNGGEVCKRLRAYKKNKRTSYISIVGFGRPKFKGAGAETPAKSAAPETEKKTCPTCGQSVK
jgi:hypothetical protein